MLQKSDLKQKKIYKNLLKDLYSRKNLNNLQEMSARWFLDEANEILRLINTSY